MNSKIKNSTRCEGHRRYGGAFSLGPVDWIQCENDAVAMLRFKQEGETLEMPACAECWRECSSSETESIELLDAQPIVNHEIDR